ncbi:MAG: protein adenylyltransferase SelO, partial [Gemmatimonadales bacterium]
VWVSELGDGRAILLGEVVNSRHQRWDVQLKGAGPTRFSRMGDGRAVLRSTVREYLAGEAMHGLGIPSTRALAIIGSDSPVYREQAETAAVLVRVAPTHVRFGSFEVFASRGQHTAVRQLADYVIGMHFAQLLTLPLAERYAAWFREVVDRTARLMAAWTATGFAHGVLNTDNMSILGISLDYGPYGWMDGYDRGFIPNHSDPAGRYAFDQQPRVGLWNCARLAEALLSLFDPEPDEAARDAAIVTALESYRATFEIEMDRLMRAKLGLTSTETGDVALVADLLGLLHDTRADYTRFFRALSRYVPGHDSRGIRPDLSLPGEVSDHERLAAWLARYAQRLRRDAAEALARSERMLRTNPKFVLRNW